MAVTLEKGAAPVSTAAVVRSVRLHLDPASGLEFSDVVEYADGQVVIISHRAPWNVTGRGEIVTTQSMFGTFDAVKAGALAYEIGLHAFRYMTVLREAV